MHRAPPRRRPLLALALAATLSACQTLAPAPSESWPQRRALLQALHQFEFRGQLAAATATDGYSATLTWQQKDESTDAALRAPLGLGAAHLFFDGALLRVAIGDAPAVEGEVARQAMVELLGFEPPLASLHYWVLGVPDPRFPGQETLSNTRRLARLVQADWQIDYANYRWAGNGQLPGLITLQREGLRLKVRVSKWQLP